MTDIQADVSKSIHRATSSIAVYQTKLMEIAKANAEFTMEYTQALLAVRSPTDLMNVNTQYTKKRVELFQQHAQELADLTKTSVSDVTSA